jgi:hypothetical protein
MKSAFRAASFRPEIQEGALEVETVAGVAVAMASSKILAPDQRQHPVLRLFLNAVRSDRMGADGSRVLHDKPLPYVPAVSDSRTGLRNECQTYLKNLVY